MLECGGYMQNFIIEFLQEYGYISLLVLMFVENVFPPIPSEMILTFAGFSCSMQYLNIFGVIVVSTLGAFLGSYLLFFIGKLLTIDKLKQFIQIRFIKILGFKEKHIEQTFDWFQKYGTKAIFFGRCVPVIRSLISIPAGISQMPILSFSLYTLFGTLIWNTVLVSLGYILGNQWEKVLIYMKQYDLLVMVCVIGFIIGYIIKRKYKNKQ